MKKLVLLLILPLFATLFFLSCGKDNVERAVKDLGPCRNPISSTSSSVYYCDHPTPLKGYQYIVGWMQALNRDGNTDKAWVELDYLRVLKFYNAKLVLQYADEYNDIKKYTDWTYGGLFLRDPWYGGNVHEEFKNGSFGTQIKDGKLLLPVSDRTDRIFHPVNSSWPTKEVPLEASYFVIETKFTIHGNAQVQVGFDGCPTSTTGERPSKESGASDWYCENKTHELTLKFDKRTRDFISIK